MQPDITIDVADKLQLQAVDLKQPPSTLATSFLEGPDHDAA